MVERKKEVERKKRKKRRNKKFNAFKYYLLLIFNL